MSTSIDVSPIEPRWPVASSILVALLLLVALPDRLMLFPGWFPYALVAVMLTPMAGVALAEKKSRWLRIERVVSLLFCVFNLIGLLVALTSLIGAMISRTSEITGLHLLASSIAVWVDNVIIFSLLYWQVDRGGPQAWATNTCTRSDWLFAQMGAPEDVPAGWRPTFIDYFFLGYTTATAFSPTDALPLTPRAKVLMLIESTISLVTIVVVASRAINILGG